MLTAERLRELLDYDPLTGVFTWRVRKGPTAPAGGLVGSYCTNGYLKVNLERRTYLLHRLAHLWVNGSWPEGQIDHIDGDRRNNKWSNLRSISCRTNRENLRRAYSTNMSGLLGVSRKGNRFQANITVKGVPNYLGSFKTAEQAHAAYVAAKRQLHEGCTL